MVENSKTCRICLLENDQNVSMFQNQSLPKVADLMKEYIGLAVEEVDSFPSSICEECSSDLSTIVKFVSKFRTTHENLQQALDLNVPFYKITSNFIKEEDDEDVPLSIVSASMKDEKSFTFVKEELSDDGFQDDDDDLYINLNRVNEDEGKEKKYVIIKGDEHGLKKKNMLQCLTCGILVQNKSAFIIHYRKHTGEKPCKCPHCEKSFTQMGTLTDHIKRHHWKDRSFLNSTALTEKIRKKIMKDKYCNEKRYTCDSCGKQFLKKNYLTVHMRVHTMEKPYKCTFCSKGFRRCIDYIQHKRIHTGERPYSCHICGKTFVSHTPLKRHLTVHSEERNFKCNMCNTAVKSSDSLKKHILVMHTTERRNVCDLCGAAFALKYNLKSHMKARHSEKSGICDICKKLFSNLPKHMNTHLGEKPYACQMCNKRFFRQKGLTTHIAKHQNETATFACTFDNCNSAFSKQCKLDFHILKYHTNHTPHVCQVCSKGFYRLPDLRRHLKSIHPPKPIVDLPLPEFTC